jgi:O-antigen/teichoic acid export membrane protein
MNFSGATIGAGIFVVAYALSLVSYSVRIMKRYPGDRGIRFGSITLIVFLCTIAAYRIPELQRSFDWILPVLVFSNLILVSLTLYFLVHETIVDVRKSRTRNGIKGKE